MKAGVEMLFIISRNQKVIESAANDLQSRYPQQKCVAIAADVRFSHRTQLFSNFPSS